MTREDAEYLTRTCGALGNPIRLGAVALLAEAGGAGLAQGRLARSMAVSSNLMSAHLAILLAAGLVVSRKAGRQVIYRPRPDALKSAGAHLCRLAEATGTVRGRPASGPEDEPA